MSIMRTDRRLMDEPARDGELEKPRPLAGARFSRFNVSHHPFGSRQTGPY